MKNHTPRNDRNRGDEAALEREEAQVARNSSRGVSITGGRRNKDKPENGAHGNAAKPADAARPEAAAPKWGW